jgi:hypothetical protein
MDRLIVGGLHRDDFEWACGQHEDVGYALIRFELDADGYHWRAVYEKASMIEKTTGGRGTPSDRLSPSVHRLMLDVTES